MKKMICTVLGVMLFAMTATPLKAQDLSASLHEAYTALQSAKDLTAMMGANSKFNLIAAKWNNAWSANYYAAYSLICISLKEPAAKRKDLLLDQADKYVDKVNSMQPSNDESMVLTAYAAFARFLVDPPNRWRKYLDLMSTNLENAKKANPDNPRIYYLKGIPVFNKPVLYGGGKNKAKPYFEKAKALFAKQSTASIEKPYWGEQDNAAYLLKCDE
jgi:hypothetical protein